MNSSHDLPEQIRGYFAERADASIPAPLLERVIASAATTRPRPGWLARLLAPTRIDGTHLEARLSRGGVDVSPQLRFTSLGWVALIGALIGVLLALAILAGGPKPRPVLGVLPTAESTVSLTGIDLATSEPGPTPGGEIAAACGRVRSDPVRPTSPGGSLAAAAPKPAGRPSNGLIAYATRSAILTYDPATQTRKQVATLAATTDAIAVGELTWSPDGRRLAFVIGTGTSTAGSVIDVFWCDLMVVNADGSGVSVLAPLGLDTRDNVEKIVWSPDGRSLVYNDGSYADLVNLTIGGSRRQLPGTHNCWWPAWSPDGSRIACLGDGSIVTVASGESVTLNLSPNGSNDSPGFPVWAADGQSITALGQSATDRSTAYRVAGDGSILSSLDLPGSSAWTPELRLSPDGSRVLARVCPVPCVNDVEYQVVPIDGSPAISLGRGYSAYWSDDSSRVAMTNADGILVADAKDGTTQLAARVSNVHVVSWSPDQAHLLFVLENGQLWAVAATGGDATLIDDGPVSTASGVAWQPLWP